MEDYEKKDKNLNIYGFIKKNLKITINKLYKPALLFVSLQFLYLYFLL